MKKIPEGGDGKSKFPLSFTVYHGHSDTANDFSVESWTWPWKLS